MKVLSLNPPFFCGFSEKPQAKWRKIMWVPMAVIIGIIKYAMQIRRSRNLIRRLGWVDPTSHTWAFWIGIFMKNGGLDRWFPFSGGRSVGDIYIYISSTQLAGQMSLIYLICYKNSPCKHWVIIYHLPSIKGTTKLLWNELSPKSHLLRRSERREPLGFQNFHKDRSSPGIFWRILDD